MEFLDRLKKYDIILGSQSPRRKDLLQHARIPFRVLAKNISEHFPDNLPPDEVVLMLCKEKSFAFENELQNSDTILLTADTIVVNNDVIINKPGNQEEAVGMLKDLSGGWHKVLTGVCIRHQDQLRLFYETTQVLFRDLSSDEILFYVNNYSPYDKAGAYGIQEWIGYVGISRLIGSYSNVVGLPVERVYSELKELISV